MTSSITPEVHNISQRHQRRTEPQPSVGPNAQNVAKTVQVASEICSRTDRQTDTLVTFVIQVARQLAYVSITISRVFRHEGRPCA